MLHVLDCLGFPRCHLVRAPLQSLERIARGEKGARKLSISTDIRLLVLAWGNKLRHRRQAEIRSMKTRHCPELSPVGRHPTLVLNTANFNTFGRSKSDAMRLSGFCFTVFFFDGGDGSDRNSLKSKSFGLTKSRSKDMPRNGLAEPEAEAMFGEAVCVCADGKCVCTD